MTLREELRALEAKLAARQGKPGWGDSVRLIEQQIAQKQAELRNGS